MAKKTGNKTPPGRTPPDLPEEMDDWRVLTADDILGGKPMEEVRVQDADFTGRKLGTFDARYALFEGVSFAGCEMPSARIRDARFVRCDLSNARLRGLQAARVEFIGCRLTGLAAIECVWQDVLVECCDGRYAQFTDGRLQTCAFTASDLSEADLRGTSLGGSTFSQVNLRQADCNRAALRDIDLRAAEIDDIVVGVDDVRGLIVTPTQAMGLARLLGLVIR